MEEREYINLQKLRMKKGLSQNQLAAKSGVNARTIRSYEQRESPIEGARLNTLCALCFALDCKIEDLLDNKVMIDKFRLAK